MAISVHIRNSHQAGPGVYRNRLGVLKVRIRIFVPPRSQPALMGLRRMSIQVAAQHGNGATFRKCIADHQIVNAIFIEIAGSHRERAWLLTRKLQVERIACPKRFRGSSSLCSGTNRAGYHTAENKNQQERNRGTSIAATQRECIHLHSLRISKCTAAKERTTGMKQ